MTITRRQQILDRRRTLCGLTALGLVTAGAPMPAAAARPTASSAVVEVVDHSSGGAAPRKARFVLGLDAGGRDSRLELAAEGVTYKIALRALPADRKASEPRVEVDLRRSLRQAVKGGKPRVTTTRLRASRRVPIGKRVVLGQIDSGAGTTEVALTLR